MHLPRGTGNGTEVRLDTPQDLVIVFIPGIATWPNRLRGWREDLARVFPAAQVHILDERMYWPWSNACHADLVGQCRALLDQARPTWVLAHSFGGLIACALLAGASVPGNVRLVTTMASPHRYRVPGIGKRARMLVAGGTVPVPMYSYGGYFDLTVPFWCTTLPGSVHANLRCGHLGFLYRSRVRARILQDARAVLSR